MQQNVACVVIHPAHHHTGSCTQDNGCLMGVLRRSYTFNNCLYPVQRGCGWLCNAHRTPKKDTAEQGDRMRSGTQHDQQCKRTFRFPSVMFR